MLYEQIISVENLFRAWEEFKKGKRNKPDVAAFERNLEDNLFTLHKQLKDKSYQHSQYTAFNIYDPKFRHIHKAIVADRIVHHAVVSVIEPIFDKTFIADSYSCRVGKGTHRAVRRLSTFCRKVSQNNKAPCFALKMDIKKFFASVDHQILISCLQEKITDGNLLWLIKNVLTSFSSGVGIPIGNLTSQIFANIYLNQLDQFLKHKLKVKYYLRYADDFLILSTTRDYLENLIPEIGTFLEIKLKLSLHKNKIFLLKYSQGIDFLGYVVLPHCVLPRTSTKKRILKKLRQKAGSINFDQTQQSYLGFLKHANAYRLSQKMGLTRK